MEKTNRKGYYADSSDFKKMIGFSPNKDEYYIEITQWDNKEGYTVSMNTSLGARVFEISYEELDMINFIVQKLNYE